MSRVSYATVSKPQPDRLEDAIEVGRQAGKLIGRHGPECRLLAAETAGEQSGTFVFVVQFESIDKYAAQVEELDKDTELRELQISLTRSSSPIISLGASISTEIPLPGKHKTGRGSLTEVHLVKPALGRLEGAIQEADTAATLMEKAGAVNAQAFTMAYAGMQSGTLGLAIEWPSVKAQALAGNIWATDPAGVALQAAMTNGTSSSTLLSSALYREVPL
jgi:hypothetical protein